jgi:hypothetical protein
MAAALSASTNCDLSAMASPAALFSPERTKRPTVSSRLLDALALVRHY